MEQQSHFLFSLLLFNFLGDGDKENAWNFKDLNDGFQHNKQHE